jgi:RHS repeat-associated protein
MSGKENTRQRIKEQKDYYPFGKEHENANLMSSTNRWGYNGKEKQIVGNLNYLDYINRMYDPEIGRWFVQDPLQEKYYSWSSYNYCMNNPVKYVDPDGREKYYAIDGSYLGQVGTNTDIRVINSTLTNTQANTHIQNGANNELTSNSVAFANYFTTVADVTNDAALQTYTNNGKNCFSAATAQLTDAGVTQTGAANAIHTLVADNSNLTSDAFGGAIRIQTELNNGNPVMVGVKETKNDGTVPNPGNNNSLTGHFVVIRSATVAANGSVTFNYLDNASTSSGKNANNNMTLDTSTGAITDEVVPARSNYQRYDVTEVRKNY